MWRPVVDQAVRLASDRPRTAACTAAREACYRGAWDAVGDRAVIAVVPGRFRPPHRGHMGLVARLARCCSAVIVVVQPDATSVRAPGGGRQVSDELAKSVWEACLPYVVSLDHLDAVFVTIGEPEDVCGHLLQACEASSACPVVVAGQEAMCVDPEQTHRGVPILLLPKEAPICSTAMATVPLWASPGDAAHLAHVVDCLPASLPDAVARQVARAVTAAVGGKGLSVRRV